MTNLKHEVKQLKKDTRLNIKLDKAHIAVNAALFLTLLSGGIAVSVQKIAENPKDVEGYMILPACMLMYLFFIAGNAIVGKTAPKMPDAHMAQYKKQLEELYQKHKKIPQIQKTK